MRGRHPRRHRSSSAYKRKPAAGCSKASRALIFLRWPGPYCFLRVTCLRPGGPAPAWGELTGAAASVSRGFPAEATSAPGRAPRDFLRRLGVVACFLATGGRLVHLSPGGRRAGQPCAALCRAGGAIGRCLQWCAVAVRALRGLVRGAHAPVGVIAQDFGLRGISAAYKLRNFRVNELGGGATGTIRAERARARRRSGAEAGAPGSTSSRVARSLRASGTSLSGERSSPVIPQQYDEMSGITGGRRVLDGHSSGRS